MFTGFSEEAVRFLAELAVRDDKEWFEEHKKIYTEQLYRPMKELCEELFKPYSKIDTMMSKAGRIYRDPNFPPYRRYREEMWLIIKHEAWNWSTTPSMFFELSGSGAVFGFKISHPTAATMENFRQKIVTDEGDFLALAKRLRRRGFDIGGDEYKRPKPCPLPEAEGFFKKKSLMITKSIPPSAALYAPELAGEVAKAFKAVFPVNELFDALAAQAEADKLAAKLTAQAEAEAMPQAPKEDFMW